MLDTFNFVVVDSNQLRSRRAIVALREAHYFSQQHAVVPWSFIYEQTKGPTTRERVSNFLASTAGFSKMPEILSAAVPTSILAIQERKGMEVTLVSELHTRIIRAAARGGSPPPASRLTSMLFTSGRVTSWIRIAT